MNEKLESLLQNFLEAYSSPFSIEDVIAYTGISDDATLRAELTTMLTSQHLAFYDPISGKFLSRSGLFSGTSFSILPTRTELIQSILFIGHRCVPFVNPDLFPHQLIFLYKDAVIPHKSVRFPTDEIYPYYYLFGDEYVPQLLTFDNEDNNSAYRENDFEEPEELDVTVLDMSAIYWDLRIEHGDRFKITVVDWLHGIVELSYIPAKTVKEKKAEEWKTTMGQSFIKCFDIIGPSSSMEEQILYSFLMHFEMLINCDDCSLEEFMQDTKTVDILPYGVESRFWRTGEKIPVTGNWADTTSELPRSDIEELFWKLGFSLPEYIMQSYIRDALFQRIPIQESILDTLLPGKDFPQEIREEISTQIEKISNVISKDYNWFRDQLSGPARNRLVALHAGISIFIHRLDMEGINIEDLPETPFIILSQLLKHICAAIDNLESIFELDDFSYETLCVSIEGMEESFFEVKTQILDSLDDIGKSRFSIVDAGENAHRGICVTAEFSVHNTDKKSIREIIVPTTWTLAQLYSAICVSCGITPIMTGSFTTPDGTIIMPGTAIELIMHDRADTIPLVLRDRQFMSDAAITIKGLYNGNRIMPFCEYATGKNASTYDGSEENTDMNILLFPNARTPSEDGTAPSASEVTDALQRLIKNETQG